jgi:hypothetical protein
MTEGQIARVISEYVLPNPPEALPAKAARAFLDYKKKSHYRAFAITPSTGHGKWASGHAWDQLQVERAINRAMKECQTAREEYGAENECQIYAVGDFIVYRMSPEELEAATAFYESDPFAEIEEIQGDKRPILTPDISGKFDGEWVGQMACSTCPHCVGTIEKSVNLTIEKGMFIFAPDLAYIGVGRVDEHGNVQIRWEQAETYAEMTRPKNIRFIGQITGGQLELRGERGPRECTLTLGRAISDRTKSAEMLTSQF